MSDRKRNNGLLTVQEKRVLKLLARAQTNKEIATTLGISPSTVKRHLESILKKLGLKNRVAAAVYAVRQKHGPWELRKEKNSIEMGRLANRVPV